MSPHLSSRASFSHHLTRVLCVGSLILTTILMLSCGGSAPSTQAESSRQIIIVNIDSLRADHLGCYGYQRATSPSIDALAAAGVRFDWAFAQAPSTAPSQASILTGLYPRTHQMVDETTRLADEVTTLAEVFSEAGIATAAFVDGGFVSEELGFAQGFGLYDNSHGAGIAEIGPKALAWLEQHGSDDFLLLIHTYDPHVPYAPPIPHDELFTADLAPATPGFSPTAEAMEAARQDLKDGAGAGLNNDLAYAMAMYDGEIHYVDAFLGELQATISSLGLDESATVVVVSDHGESFGEHGDLLHEQVYTPVTRVPLILRLPGGDHQGTVITKNVETVDLMPTVLDLAGLTAPSQVQGKSLLPMLTGQSQPPYLAFSETNLNGGQRAVALGGVRLVLHDQDGRQELFDLTTDPLESTDIAASEPEKLAVLAQHIEEWTAATEAAAIGAAQDSDIDQATLDQLKGLGYIQ